MGLRPKCRCQSLVKNLRLPDISIDVVALHDLEGYGHKHVLGVADLDRSSRRTSFRQTSELVLLDRHCSLRVHSCLLSRRFKPKIHAFVRKYWMMRSRHYGDCPILIWYNSLKSSIRTAHTIFSWNIARAATYAISSVEQSEKGGVPDCIVMIWTS